MDELFTFFSALSLPFWAECVAIDLALGFAIYVSAFLINFWLGRRPTSVRERMSGYRDVFAFAAQLQKELEGQPPSVWERVEQHPLGRKLLALGFIAIAPGALALLVVALPIGLLLESWHKRRDRQALELPASWVQGGGQPIAGSARCGTSPASVRGTASGSDRFSASDAAPTLPAGLQPLNGMTTLPSTRVSGGPVAIGPKHLLHRLTVDEIERREAVVDPLRAEPLPPFGHLHGQWQAFRSGLPARAELWSFQVRVTHRPGLVEDVIGYVALYRQQVQGHLITEYRRVLAG